MRTNWARSVSCSFVAGIFRFQDFSFSAFQRFSCPPIWRDKPRRLPDKPKDFLKNLKKVGRAVPSSRPPVLRSALTKEDRLPDTTPAFRVPKGGRCPQRALLLD